MDQNETADEIISTLRQIIRAIDLQSKKLTKKFGLTGPQLIVLKEIKKYPDKPISKISQQVSLSQATVTSILDRLEQQGFAYRKRSSVDKRKVHITLTEKAETILATNPSFLQEEFTDQLGKLQEWEKYMVLSSLKRLAELMKAESIPAHPVLVSGPIEAPYQHEHSFLTEDVVFNKKDK